MLGCKEFCFSDIVFGSTFNRKIADLLDSDILKTRMQVFWDVTLCRWLCGSRCFKGFLCLNNVGNHSPMDTASHPRKVESLVTLL